MAANFAAVGLQRVIFIIFGTSDFDNPNAKGRPIAKTFRAWDIENLSKVKVP
jgi:hypothetical protein